MYIAGKIPCGNWRDPLERSPAMVGLGCVTCGGGCSGLGDVFGDSLNPANWGWQDWLAVIGIGYTVFSLAFTSKRAISRARAIPGERRKARAAYYRKKAAAISKR